MICSQEPSFLVGVRHALHMEAHHCPDGLMVGAAGFRSALLGLHASGPRRIVHWFALKRRAEQSVCEPSGKSVSRVPQSLDVGFGAQWRA